MKAICNFRYARSKRGSAAFPDVRGLLRYLTYRNDRDGHIPGAGGRDRWVDGGLGSNYPEILKRLDELGAYNRHAYCHSIVISPDPEAMAAWRERQDDEGDPQARFVEAVRDIMAEWDEWREEHDNRPPVGPIEYSFVVHRPVREYGEQMHAHVILAPATEDPMLGEVVPLYNNQPEIEAFKAITYRELERAFGLERERERDEPELGVDLGWEEETSGLERGLDIDFHGL